jgi:hypothetical protein
MLVLCNTDKDATNQRTCGTECYRSCEYQRRKLSPALQRRSKCCMRRPCHCKQLSLQCIATQPTHYHTSNCISRLPLLTLRLCVAKQVDRWQDQWRKCFCLKSEPEKVTNSCLSYVNTLLKTHLTFLRTLTHNRVLYNL